MDTIWWVVIAAVVAIVVVALAAWMVAQSRRRSALLLLQPEYRWCPRLPQQSRPRLDPCGLAECESIGPSRAIPLR